MEIGLKNIQKERTRPRGRKIHQRIGGSNAALTLEMATYPTIQNETDFVCKHQEENTCVFNQIVFIQNGYFVSAFIHANAWRGSWELLAMKMA